MTLPLSLPAWPEQLYPKVAPTLAAAYAVFAAADDASVTRALAVLRATAAWPRVISNLQELKTARGLRSRLMHKVMYDLYTPHVMVVFRIACLLDPTRGETLLVDALSITRGEAHLHNDLLEIAFDGGVSSARMTELVETFELHCDPWWQSHVGAAIARSGVATDQIVARLRCSNASSWVASCASIFASASVRRCTATSSRAIASSPAIRSPSASERAAVSSARRVAAAASSAALRSATTSRRALSMSRVAPRFASARAARAVSIAAISATSTPAMRAAIMGASIARPPARVWPNPGG